MICTIINNETGEIITENFVVEELEEKQKKKEIMDKRKSEDEFKSFIDEVCGNFYFMFFELLSKGVTRQMITRFVYLCTFMNYENKLIFGKSKDAQCRFMIENDLEEVLRMSERECNRTKEALVNNDLIVIKDHCIEINDKYAFKGKLQGLKLKTDSKVRIFEQTIKELYEKATPKEHKKICLLFEILPYINLKYNIVCENPDCENMKEVEPITLTELSELLGFSTVQRMKQGLFDLTVNGEKVIALFTIDGDSMILVNPKIYYKGVKLEDVKLLCDMFSIKKDKNKKKKSRAKKQLN
jgi:hypothetical protein